MRHRSILGVSAVTLLIVASGVTPVIAQSTAPASPAPSTPTTSGSSAPSGGAAPLGGADISGAINVFGFGYETGDEIAKVRVDHFRELYPDVQVTFSESGWDEQQFITAISGSQPPDLVNIPRNVMGTYVAKNVLTPLE